jgi:hypothetical protein
MCGYTLPFWETHCDYTSRDSIQGACGRVDDAGLRIMDYPCAAHRGMNGPNQSGRHIREDRQMNM